MSHVVTCGGASVKILFYWYFPQTYSVLLFLRSSVRIGADFHRAMVAAAPGENSSCCGVLRGIGPGYIFSSFRCELGVIMYRCH